MDSDSNGLYDRLEIAVNVKASVAGEYRWNASLTNDCGQLVGSASGDVNLSSDVVQTITLAFDGHAIGRAGVSGAFKLDTLRVTGPASASEPETVSAYDVAETDSYNATAFEEYTPAVDLNLNGTPDVCDIFHGNSRDCNGNSIVDEAENDNDADGDDEQHKGS